MVQMPDKLENGQILRYEGKGRVSSHTGKVGDLYVTVNIQPAPIPVKLIAAGAMDEVLGDGSLEQVFLELSQAEAASAER